MESNRKEYELSVSSIWSFVWRGIVVGIVSGTIVSLFRLFIEDLFEKSVQTYQLAHDKPIILVIILIVSVSLAGLIGFLVKSDPNIKGSGIPHIEGELKGLIHPDWWSVLWKKFIGGILAISLGLMLGREGPSIQLGGMSAKGVAHFLKASRMEKRILMASGAAAGLSAAFNAPIAGLLFIVEEVYHHFSRLIWITALVASLLANFISLNIFGLTPVLAMPKDLVVLSLQNYWIVIILGLFLGVMAYVYEKVILNFGKCYDVIGKILHIAPHFYGIFAVVLIIPIGYFFPQLLGGGNDLITSLASAHMTFTLALVYFLIRFVWSMFSYSSGLPGGIFLPILTLGALLGLVFVLPFIQCGILTQNTIPLFIVLGMAGYFSAISKAPLTAMILVTEMVGDLKQLMALGVVTLIAFIIMDMLKGEPIYEAMLEKMAPKEDREVIEPTLIQLIVTDKLSGKRVRDLTLPKHVLLTTKIHNKRSEVVSGDTVLYTGDIIFLVVNEPQVGRVRQLFM